MDKNTFDDAIGEPPPSTVRVDEAIARGRREARVRQVATPAAGAVAVVALTVGAMSFLAPDPSRTPPATPSSSPTVIIPTGCPQTLTETDREATGRLSALARELVGDRLPDGARLVDGEGDGSHEPLEFVKTQNRIIEWVECAARPDEPDGRYTTGAGIAVAGGEAAIEFTVYPYQGVGRADPCGPWAGTDPAPECASIAGPDGEAVHTRVDETANASATLVSVIKPDGTYLEVSYHSPERSIPSPLSLDEVVEIALDPGMTLYP